MVTPASVHSRNAEEWQGVINRNEYWSKAPDLLIRLCGDKKWSYSGRA